MTDAAALPGFVNGEVGEVTAVGVVGNGAGDADEAVVVPGGNEQVGVLQHGVNALGFSERAARAKAGLLQQRDELGAADGVVGTVSEHRFSGIGESYSRQALPSHVQFWMMPCASTVKRVRHCSRV